MASVAGQNGVVLNGETVSKDVQLKIFEKVDNEAVPDLEPILKERLPISATIFNNCKNHSSWADSRKWYVLGGEISSRSWILSTILRPDFGLEITVSRPANSVVTSEIRDAFSKASFMDWSESYVFAGVDTVVSGLVVEISTREKGNCTHTHPCYLYSMDIEDGLRLSDKFDHGEGVEVKEMNNTKGEEFLLSTWKYVVESGDQYIRTCLQRSPSAGVYVNGKIQSGVAFASHGLIGMLYTLNGSRGKGYAKSAMHSVMKRCAENGLIPACTVEQRNEISKAFQVKIGFKLAGEVDFVVYTNTGF